MGKECVWTEKQAVPPPRERERDAYTSHFVPEEQSKWENPKALQCTIHSSRLNSLGYFFFWLTPLDCARYPASHQVTRESSGWRYIITCLLHFCAESDLTVRRDRAQICIGRLRNRTRPQKGWLSVFCRHLCGATTDVVLLHKDLASRVPGWSPISVRAAPPTTLPVDAAALA